MRSTYHAAKVSCKGPQGYAGLCYAVTGMEIIIMCLSSSQLALGRASRAKANRAASIIQTLRARHGRRSTKHVHKTLQSPQSPLPLASASLPKAVRSPVSLVLGLRSASFGLPLLTYCRSTEVVLEKLETRTRHLNRS